jgi:hypothetical protein
LVDAIILYIFDPPIGWVVGGWGYHSVLFVANRALGDVSQAPVDSLLYSSELEVLLNGVYVVRTIDGLYAKFQMLRWDPAGAADFEYYVQMDGSTNLDSTIPVCSTTWGRLKTLYSQ